MTARIELPPTGRIEEATASGRPRRVLAGEGMVVPVRKIDLKVDGGWEAIEPPKGGRSEMLCRDHPAVRQRPECFRPAWRDDRATADHLRKLLGRAEREELRAIEQQRRGTGSRPRGDWRLPGPPRERWRLP
jgi:hypothetical protein